MFRTLLTLLAFAAPLFAQPPKAPETRVKIGDPAPPLAADKWLIGKEVKGFEKDTVYVLSFTDTADFSFPAGIASLSDLHDSAAGKVVVVGVHRPRLVNPSEQDKAKAFADLTTAAKKSGASYPMAWDGDSKMWDAYVGKDAYHSAFVIDKAGKVAFIGLHDTAAYVAGKVLGGTWKGQADIDAMTEADAKLKKFMDETGKKIAPDGKFDDKAIKALQGELPALEKMFKDSPYLQATSQGWGMRFLFHQLAQSYDVADEMLTARIVTATKRKNPKLLVDLIFTLGLGPPQAQNDPKLGKLVAKFTDGYAGLLDPKKAATDEFDGWSMLVVFSKKHGNTEKAEAYTKVILDATPADKRKEMEEAIKWRLKDAGVDK